MKKLDWHYITEERAKSNISVLAMESIRLILLDEELTKEQAYHKIEGVLYLADAITDNLEAEDGTDT